MVCPAPIFLLSAGWRSGSTLLQRLVCSDPGTLIWGEPFEEFAPVQRMAASIEHLVPDSPHLRWSIDQFDGSMTENWIGNLNPGVGRLRHAHLNYMESLFGEPAVSRNFSRWGVKFVRLTARHGRYLQWLYPQAKFVLLVRHPLDAYQSYKGKHWYTVRPSHLVDSAFRFMSHWRLLVESFLAEREALGAQLVIYDDLIGRDETVAQLEEHLGMPLDRRVLRSQVGGRTRTDLKVNSLDRLVCRTLTGDLCRALGFGPR